MPQLCHKNTITISLRAGLGELVTDITRRTDYAIRILFELARRPRGTRLTARQLGESQEIPYPFARRILTELAAAGYIDTRRGTGGGAGLARPAAEITLGGVIAVMDGPISVSPCTRDLSFCSRDDGCAIHEVWQRVDDLLADYLTACDLASLAEHEAQQTGAAPMERRGASSPTRSDHSSKGGDPSR
jgi:Rrf2 family protein